MFRFFAVIGLVATHSLARAQDLAPNAQAAPNEEAASADADESTEEETTDPDNEARTSPAHVYDLAALTRLAEGRSFGRRAAQEATRAAEARLSEAIWSPFFQFTATGTLALSPGAEGTPIFTPDDQDQLPLSNEWGPVTRIALEGAIPLYTFGKLSSAREAAQAGVDAADARLSQSTFETRLNVRRAYFALQMALDTEQMLSEGRGKLDRAVTRLEERIEEGDPDANELDRWRLSSTVAEIEARASEAERLRRSSQAALQFLTGLDEVNVPDCPLAPVEYEIADAQTYLRDARETRTELRALRAAVRAREANRDAQTARYFPDFALALSASYGYAPHIADQNNPFVADAANGAGIGAALVMKYPFDFPGAYFRRERADAELAEIEAQYEEALIGIHVEISAAYEELRDAQRREQAWGRGHRDTRAWFVAAAQAFQVGTLEPKDLVDAIKAYFTARFSHLQAIRDYDTALARLERLVGRELLPIDRWEISCEE